VGNDTSRKVDANDFAAAHGPQALADETDRLSAESQAAMRRELAEEVGLARLDELVARHHERYRPALIEGLLREGEIANCIAPPKVGKSWCAYHIALSVASGRPLFDRWDCRQGSVLIIDNELHPETISARLPAVRRGMGLPESVEREIHVACLRDRLRSIGLGPEGEDGFRKILSTIQTAAPTPPRLVIIDSLYRILPSGISENDNATIAQVFNRLTAYSAMLDGAGILLIHHASKGSQARKSVTDVGSGAGSLSRAADTHLILRRHEEPDHFTLEAVTRTWPKPEPLVLEWSYPLWRPTDLEPRVQQRGASKRPCRLGSELTLAAYLAKAPMNTAQVIAAIQTKDECSEKNAKNALDAIVAEYDLRSLRAADGPKDFCGIYSRQPKEGDA